MKKIKLNNCPFCGSKVNLYKGMLMFSPMYYIKCDKCEVWQKCIYTSESILRFKENGGSYFEFVSKTDKEAIQEVIDNWNRIY